MSGFEDSEYDEAITTAINDISFEDHIKNGMRPHHRHSVQLNTNFTPVRDSSPLPNSHSGMTSPAPSSEGGRRSSLRRSSINGAPSDELMATTAARVNDKATLEEKHRARSPSYLHVQELPQSSHLLATTVARVFEQNALEEQRQRKGSPQRGFKIANEDFQVSSSLLRPTASRAAELKAIEEAKRPPSPTFKIAPPDFQLSERLMKTTKKLANDRLALEEKKNGPKKAPSNGKKVSKDYTPAAHLVKPTQSFICSQNQWEKEKEDKRNAKDIWWEERRPAEKARARPNTPSKLRSPTKAFLNAKRDKAPISQSIFASPEEALAYNPPASLPTPPALPENSHLLKPTRAAEMSKIGAELPPEYLPKPPSLDLATRKSFSKSVDSKLYETTLAYEASKFGADLHVSVDETGPKEKVHSPSERLLKLNVNCAHHVRDKAEKSVNAREEGWNPFLENKERNYPCPANRKRTGLHKHVSQEKSSASLSMMSVGYDDGTIPSRDNEEDFNDEINADLNNNNNDDDDDNDHHTPVSPATHKKPNLKSPPVSANKRTSLGNSSSNGQQSKTVKSPATPKHPHSQPQPASAAKSTPTAPKPASAVKKATMSPSSSSSSAAAVSATKPKPKAVIAAEVVKKAMNSIKEHTKAANPHPIVMRSSPAPVPVSAMKKSSTVSSSSSGHKSHHETPPARHSSTTTTTASSPAAGDLASKIAAAEELARTGVVSAVSSVARVADTEQSTVPVQKPETETEPVTETEQEPEAAAVVDNDAQQDGQEVHTAIATDNTAEEATTKEPETLTAAAAAEQQDAKEEDVQGEAAEEEEQEDEQDETANNGDNAHNTSASNGGGSKKKKNKKNKNKK